MDDLVRADNLVARRGLDPGLAHTIGLCGPDARTAVLESLESLTGPQIAALNAAYRASLAAQAGRIGASLREAFWLVAVPVATPVLNLATKVIRRIGRQRAR